MTRPRLRVLPVYNGVPGQHYLVLDRVPWSAERVEVSMASVEGRLAKANGTLLVFSDVIDIPEADDYQ